MTYDELKDLMTAKPSRRRPASEEHLLQVRCVNWFRIQFRRYHHNLFAVPNGGQRNRVVAAKLKAEGVLPGVADLILLLPNANYHALLIELKTQRGRQSESQREWQQHVEAHGYRYVVCRTFAEFRDEVCGYINNSLNSLQQ